MLGFFLILTEVLRINLINLGFLPTYPEEKTGKISSFKLALHPQKLNFKSHNPVRFIRKY